LIHFYKRSVFVDKYVWLMILWEGVVCHPYQ